MQPHIDVITLAVGDLDLSLAFYRDGLGLETTGVVATELVDEQTNAAGAIVIFRLKGGLVLALYPRSELAKDADHRRRASSASDSSSRAEPRSMSCWPKPNKPARLSRDDPTIARGGSTPATSATPTDTSGKSSGTRPPIARRGETLPPRPRQNRTTPSHSGALAPDLARAVTRRPR
jgi:catechol 2,3-dioxygenase-like lactoylglutathione lyase family enzyme